MDLFVIEKLIESRRKSVDSIKAAVAEGESAAGLITNPAVRKILLGQVKVRKARLAQLEGELKALQDEADRLQPSLPGVGAKSRPGAK